MKSNGSMNRVYRIVWNAAKCVWQAVCETGKGNGKEKSARRLRRASAVAGLLLAGGALAAPLPNELPSGGTVVAGSATISSSGSRMDVLQTTQKAAIDWQTFNIGSAAHVHFEQPSGGAALNRVLDTNASQIYGKLTSTGQVFLVNPNGVLFAPGAQVDVGGLVASTLGISNTDFMAGNYKFEGASSNAIINQGNITAAPGGTIALIAAKITNEGTLTAEKGNVLLGAGSKVTLDMGGPVKLQIENDALETLIENGGAIKADGGVVWLTSQAANNLASSVINNTGVIEAQNLATGEKGEVILFAHGGHMQVGGTIKAEGGFVETSGKTFGVTEGATVRAAHWLIDPNEITIDAAMATTLEGQLSGSGTASVQTSAHDAADPGNIVIAAPMSWGSGTLTLKAHNNINVNALMSITNTGGIVLNYGWDGASAYGTRGGINMAMNAAKNAFTGRIDVASTGSVSINDTAYTIIRDRAGLAAMASGLTGKYVLGTDFALGATNWTRIGYREGGGVWTTVFSGVLNGLGHTVSGLTMTTANLNNSTESGLFGRVNNGTVSNIGVTDVAITAGATSHHYIGALAGNVDGTTKISNVFSTGSITAESQNVGGLIGAFGTGSVGAIDNAHSSVAINAAGVSDTSAYRTGGLIGIANGIISNSSASGVVKGYNSVGGLIGVFSSYQAIALSNSYATGAVFGARDVGGLIGDASSGAAATTITKSYAIGNVTGTGADVGGLVGNQGYYVQLKESYASGNVVGDTRVGGLVGLYDGQIGGGLVENSYATGSVSGTNEVGGLLGMQLGNISKSFAYGQVTGSGASVRGLVGSRAVGTVTSSFYDSTANPSLSTDAYNVGKTTADLKKSATFTGWDIVEDSSIAVGSAYPQLRWKATGVGAGSSVWVIGPSGTPVTYTFDALSGTYTYNGNPYSLTNLWSASSLFGATYSSWALGTDYNFKQGGSTVTSFTNAGTYSSITVDILKSGFVAASSGNTAGSFTIAKAPLTVTANNVSTTYNGNAYAGTPGVTYSGFVTPTGGSQETTSVLGGTLAYAYSTANPTNAASYTITPSGYTSDNYQFTYYNGTLSVDKKALTVTGLTASNKIFDGTTTTTVTGAPVLNGVIGSDLANVSLTGTAAGQFADASVGNNKSVLLTGLTLTGSASGNYSLTAPAGFTASIGADRVLETAVANAQAAVQSSMPMGSSNPSSASTSDTIPSQLLSTALPTVVPTGGSTTLPVFAVSGGLALVQLSPAEGQQGGQGGGSGTTNIQSVAELPRDVGGRDPLGFMRVFVVGGGLNLAPVALNAFGQAPLGNINNQ